MLSSDRKNFMTPHAKSAEPSALAFSVEQAMEAIPSSVSGSVIPNPTVPPAALNLREHCAAGGPLRSTGAATGKGRHRSQDAAFEVALKKEKKMKGKRSSTKQHKVLDGASSPQPVLRAILMRQGLGYCLIFAAISAGLCLPLAKARSNDARTADRTLPEQRVRRERLKLKFINRTLLKQQTKFQPAHKRPSLLAVFAGNDDCPGKPIPEGNYTAAAPYSDSGDTTGANDTVSHLDDGWDSWDTSGADHVYSFTLTEKGANPEIRVSTSSSSFRPTLYVLDHRSAGCPAGTKNSVHSFLTISPALAGGTAILNSEQMSLLPLNVPLYLIVDSNPLFSSGAYTLRIQDVTIAHSNANPIDSQEFFVRQHYLDFLNREPEDSGLFAWLGVLSSCALDDQECAHEKRLTTSAALFGSTEFQLKGYFAFRFYRIAFARLPDFSEISTDMQSVTGQTPAEVYSHKANFASGFVQRPEFTALYNQLSNADYVAALLGKYGLTSITAPDPTQPDGPANVILTQAELLNRLNSGNLTRAQVLRAIADSFEVFQFEFNRAFVAMQYYGYLRRNPEAAGYNAWLDYLNAHPQDFREMVRGFVDSTEYRSRFGQP